MLFDLFHRIASPAGDQLRSETAFLSTLQQVAAQFSGMANDTDRRAGITAVDATPPASRTFAAQPSSTEPTSSAGFTLPSVVSKVFESGFGLVPVISGLLGLFGGGASEPPPFIKYAMPARLSFSGTEAGLAIRPTDYDQWGMPRIPGSLQSAESGERNSSTAAAVTPQITVNVQAMDSRSFLDHSNEIAQAVRQAMLNLSSINDVVNEL